jgi:hypothetical protein
MADQQVHDNPVKKQPEAQQPGEQPAPALPDLRAAVHRPTPQQVIALQRLIGNAATQRMMRAEAPPLAIPLTPVPMLSIQTFDPRYHRQSVVEGLEQSQFSDTEIGAIYAANWERDLSQAHPALGAIILAWKSCKIAAFEGRLTQADIDKFDGTIISLMTLAMTANGRAALTANQAYGGYAFYEHMDNPGEDTARTLDLMKMFDKGVLPDAPPGVPNYVVLSREYIKAELFGAAKAYRVDKMGSGGIGQKTADDFAAASQSIEDLSGRGTVSPGGVPGQAAGDEAAIQSRQGRAASGAPSPASGPSATGAFNAEVADHLGRASHALEDFFAHSNFVENAIEAALNPDAAREQQIKTGTFGDNDKTHSLAHKIRGLADEIEAEMPLVNRVAGKTQENPNPEDVHAGSEAEPASEEHDHHDNPILSGLTTLIKHAGDAARGAWRGGKEGFRRGGILGAAWGALKGAVAGLILNADGVKTLRDVAEKLEDDSRAQAGPDSHTTLAKDQAGHDEGTLGKLRTIKFEMALDCAREADKLIIGPMKAVMDAPDAAQADVRLQEVYRKLDQLIALPSKEHPLSPILESKMEAAKQAQIEHQLATQPQYNDAPMPRADQVPV